MDKERDPFILVALTFRFHYVGATGILITFVPEGIYVSGVCAQLRTLKAVNDEA